ncbi:PIN domain-containing protein [Halorientalis regularis]|jgi:predicted nucleic acid-binding protein|uniref:Ribonuclease VapC n=1 Tax=Halorientalis regularis TaxID=660518 RepID=A0A1G7HLA3_9EURY|nr:PIN domain-containing protein [Halorientalis regularis]SDF01106.1 PIN domain-containing protein [Halorientalis regularis]
MKIFDSSFLIDYEHGVDETLDFLERHEREPLVVPAIVLAEFVVGFALGDDHTVSDGLQALSWAEIEPISERTAIRTGEVVEATAERGHAVTGIDAIVAGVARERNATLVVGDSDLTAEAVREVIDVVDYRKE